MKKPAIHSQPVDIPRRNPDIVPRCSLQNNASHPIPAHQPIKGIYHGVSSRQTTVLFVASYEQKQNNETNTHTRSKTKTDEAPSGSTQKPKGRLFQLIRIFRRKIGVSGNWNCHHSAKVSRLLQNLIQDSKVALHFQSQKCSCWIHIHGTKTKVETLRSREN